MKPLFPALFLGLGLSTVTITPAVAYPVDCAILLCLAGVGLLLPNALTLGGLHSPHHALADRAAATDLELPDAGKFSRRAAAAGSAFLTLPSALICHPRAVRYLEGSTNPILVDAQADVDISDATFDFVRSIRVFEVTYQQSRDNDEHGCSRWGVVYSATYGEQGDYTRRRSNIAAVPEASDLKIPANCNSYRHRSVFVEWRDYAGTYGHEEVHY